MKNIYGGTIDEKDLEMYFKQLVNKCFKLLPMKEQGSQTLDKYLRSLLLELCSGQEMLVHETLFLDLIFNLHSLVDLDDIKLYKSQVFKCIGLCESIGKKLGDANG